MVRNSKDRGQGPGARGQGGQRDAARIARTVLGVLLALNVIAAGLVMYPPSGSAEGLERELSSLQVQVRTALERVEKTRKQVASIEKGRAEGDQFLAGYFLDRGSVNSTLAEEVDGAARRAGLKDRGNTYAGAMIEGSDTLGMMTISANYEGTYDNLLSFVRELDRTPSLLIIESLQATPQTGSKLLTLVLKINAFTREGPEQPAPAVVAETRP